MSLLSIENLTLSIHGLTILQDVSLTIEEGEIVAVTGESGSGKSMTALATLQLLPTGTQTTGRILLGGHDLTQQSEPALCAMRGNDVGMVFQEPMTALNPVQTIGAQVAETIRIHDRTTTRAAAEARAADTLTRVGLPQDRFPLSRYPHELSGGQRQRVVIAMAIALRPRLLIADEPTTALDVTTQAQILDLLKHLAREDGMGLMMITHDLAVVADMADRIVVMREGKVVEHGETQHLLRHMQHPYTKMLFAASTHQVTLPKVTPQPALLEVKNLTTYFPVKGGPLRRHVANVHAVEDVSFTLNKGETLSLVGESGCGKSTCGRSILRLVEPTSGSVIVDRKDILAAQPRDLRRLRREMQMIFQDPFASLNPYMRLSAQVAEPMRNFGLARGSELQDRVAGLFDRVELPRAYMRRFPHELSGGQRQRIAIARALAVSPKLIIADEAVSALDVSVQAQVLNLMMELQADLGLSFLFISHDMAVVERVSHHVAVMYLGRIVEIGPRAAIFENPQHEYTKALMLAVPIADPSTRKLEGDLNFKPIPSPMHPRGYVPAPSQYDTVAPGHLVLRGS
jgi:peptide/nickel transport system ATP-binding protein/glutathione transport system ATP-binding protein